MSKPRIGYYKGIIENNNDPQKRGRLQVRLPFHGLENSGGFRTVDLPWALPASQIYIDPPLPIGSIVFVTFENNDENFPVWTGYLVKHRDSDCYVCKHLFAAERCDAFPEGIPEPIVSGEVLHTEPYPGDGGILFEKLDEEE